MPKTDFTAQDNGFRFSNNDIKWSWGPIHATALCGGMSYAALDYYHAGLEVPQTKDVPTEGSPLHKYIYDRQMAAHGNTVPRFLVDRLPIIGLPATALPQAGELKTLGEYLRGGKPIPICLIISNGTGHHVVATGYQEKPFSIDVYDPNAPFVPGSTKGPTQIIIENGHYVNTHNKARPLHGFFVDTSYSPEQPEIIEGQDNWRLCFGCRSLFRATGADRSVCSAGGAHFNNFSANYTLAQNAGHGEHGWRRCSKCACLFYGGDPADPGLCPDGGLHNGLGSDDYVLAKNAGTGQTNWYWCKKCQGLFFYGSGQYGKCADGGGHDPSSSPRYFLPFG